MYCQGEWKGRKEGRENERPSRPDGLDGPDAAAAQGPVQGTRQARPVDD